MTLRAYQQEAVEQLQDGDLYVGPTGVGKTRILCEVARRAAEAGHLVLWVAHQRELLFQASRALREAWLTPGQNVLVRSIQELRLKPETVDKVELLIVDEAHHLGGEDWGQLPAQFPRASLIGASATPQRGDGKALSPPFSRIVQTITIASAIEQGYLVKPEVLRPEKPLGPGELAQSVVQACVDHARGLKTIVFLPTVDACIQEACKLRDAGFVTAAVWGEQPVENRRKAFEMFTAGEIEVLTSVALLTEGFDCPAVECVILARGFGTDAGYIQAVGRGMRPYPGKDRCLILDLRGVSHIHGDPDEARTYHLEGKGIRRAGDDIEVRFCLVCGSPVVQPPCETCGHSGEMRRRPPRVLGLPLERFARIRQDDEEAQARRLARWMGEARGKGWKTGHAMHRFKGAYGAWPTREVQRLAMGILSSE